MVSLYILGFISLAIVTEGWGLLDQKSWTYEIKSVESTSAEPDLLNVDIHAVRVSRGVYAISGEFFLKFDIVEGDGNTFGAKSYRSPMGDGDFKILPFHVPPTNFMQYINSYYKQTVMESLKDCSNLPYFKDDFVGPLLKNKYILTKCQISQDGFPNYLQDGMYKVVLYGNGTANWRLEITADVQQTI